MSERSASHAAKRMNRPTGAALGALGTVAGCLTLVVHDIALPLISALVALVTTGVWLWIELKRGKQRLVLTGGVIVWATLTALGLSLLASVLFALQDPASEWTVVVIVLAIIYIAPVAILTALLLGLFARALFKAPPNETSRAEIGGDTRT